MRIAIIVLGLVGFLITAVAGLWLGYALLSVVIGGGYIPWQAVAAVPVGYTALLVASIAYKKIR